jgi:hypothetical protein
LIFAEVMPCPGFARFIWRIGADWPEAVLERGRNAGTANDGEG